MLNAWDRFLLNIHVTGQATANQVQNLGNKVLAETEVFESYDNFSFLINRELRELLSTALPYRERFDGFLADISRTQDEVIEALSNCDRALEEDFAAEISFDLTLAENCLVA